MGARKVQITGKSTFMITLPKRWAVDVGLKAGSLISITYCDDGTLLLIPPTNKPFVTRKSLRIDGETGELKKEIIGSYVMGHQFIEVMDEQKDEKIPPELRKEIKGICKSLIGCEIGEETETKIVIYDILNPSEFTLEKGLKRMYALVSGMLMSLIETLTRSAEAEQRQEIITRDEEVDRVFLLIVKLFTKRLKEGWISKEDQLNLVEAFHYRLAAEHLERIGDHSVKIATTLLALDGTAGLSEDSMDQILEVGSAYLKSIDQAINALRRKNPQLANSVLTENEKLKERIAEMNLVTLGSVNALPLGIIIDSVSRIGDYASNIAELAIDLSQL